MNNGASKLKFITNDPKHARWSLLMVTNAHISTSTVYAYVTIIAFCAIVTC